MICIVVHLSSNINNVERNRKTEEMLSLEKEYITNYNSLLFPQERNVMTAEEHMEVNIYTGWRDEAEQIRPIAQPAPSHLWTLTFSFLLLLVGERFRPSVNDWTGPSGKWGKAWTKCHISNSWLQIFALYCLAAFWIFKRTLFKVCWETMCKYNLVTDLHAAFCVLPSAATLHYESHDSRVK